MAEDSKTYVFGADKASGIDASTLLAMMNGNNGFGGNCNWLWVIFLFFLYGWGGNGMFGNRNNGSGLANEINNDYGRSLLLQAINGNGTAISQLASTLNCDVNSIQSAISAVSSNIQSVSAQVGMSGQQVINAIQSGNQTIAAQLAQCCCDNKLLITTQGYENQLATVRQTETLGSKIDSVGSTINNEIAKQTTLLSDKFCELEKREMQNKIDALREERSTLQGQISNANQTSQIQQYVAGTITPLATALAALQTELSNIKSKLPETVNVPYSPVVGVSSCVASQLGLNSLGLGSVVSTGSIWG
jgi:hypothetical protein